MFCDEVSIEHADGTTECLDPDCTEPHDAHHLRATCECIPVRPELAVAA